MYTREHKGKSLIDFPSDYIVIDIETTGLDPEYDNIIEMSAIKVRRNEIVDRFTSLCKPKGYFTYFRDPTDDDCKHYIIRDGVVTGYVDSFITKLTGITNQMIEDAPDIDCVLKSFHEFIKDDILIGHNVNFDVNFLYDHLVDSFNTPLTNDFIDTLRIARKLLKELKHHRLNDLIVHYQFDERGLHRALDDCIITNNILVKLKKDATNVFGNLDAFVDSFKMKSCDYATYAKNIVTQSNEFDETHPLFGRVCVFTGALEKMVRKDAMQIVANLGGINGDGVTAKTNLLILGNNDYCSSIKDGKSNKQKKAENLILKGQDLQIISENVFYDLIDAV